MNIADLVRLGNPNKGTARLIGFETSFFNEFKMGGTNSSENPILPAETTYGHYRLVLQVVEETLEGGRYQLDIYDDRTKPREGNNPMPPNLKARKTFQNPKLAFATYSAVEQALPSLR
jgi:hypothetical protein